MSKMRFGYMDMTDYYHELGGGPTCQVYSSIEQLKKGSPCSHECGIVKVLVTLVEVVQDSTF